MPLQPVAPTASRFGRRFPARFRSRSSANRTVSSDTGAAVSYTHLDVYKRQLPQGWKATASASSSGATSGCVGRPFGASQRIAQIQASFQDPSGLPDLFEQISDYNSPSTVFAKGVRDLNRCHNVSISQSGAPLKIHVARLAYRGGRLTAAYTLSFVVKNASVGRSQDVGIDVVLVRVGDEIVEVGLADAPRPQVSQLRSFRCV